MKRTVKQVKLKDIVLGDGRVTIQSMLNRPAEDIAGSVAQAVQLEKAGCEIVRAAIPNREAVSLVPA
ncbi:MAG: flavodoxin-dependent (E)-4-hydroxy-3-methylbut-2-enyl-diphosphate synthase, partial [Clostridiales bacterium]|nr:flavodoxin-dependent (E)-4-hydroxy-3-methylbut-2-enyl-diphosphate synthase [Clostridiales bacterium]